MSAFECKSLIQATESLGFSTPIAFDKSVRVCERRHTVDLGMSDAIMSRLKSYLPEIVHDEGKEEVCPTSTAEVLNELHEYDKDVQSLLYILVSGKRASGKDYITNLICESLIAKGISVHRTALGHINKRSYAASIGIDAIRLKNDREFKESHRIAMIAHHTARNAQDPEWCLKEVKSNAQQANTEVLLLSDIRTLQDLHWFKQQPGEVVLLRITASDETRKSRGWIPCQKKDSLHTETELDRFFNWTACWDNSDLSTESNQLLHEWIEDTVIPKIPLSKLRNSSFSTRITASGT